MTIETTTTSATPSDPPVCRDCLHYNPDSAGCSHPDLMTFDPVHGRKNAYAPSQRRPGMRCGFDGKLFVPFPAPTASMVARRFAFVCGIILAFLIWQFVR